ncbi:hypothetical protein PG987_001879 [Apiospora arundinis]
MILECALTPFIALRGILAAANAPIACRAASPSLRIASGNIHYVATLHETNGQPRSTRRSVVVLTLSKTVAKSHNAIFIGRQEALASQLEHSKRVDIRKYATADWRTGLLVMGQSTPDICQLAQCVMVSGIWLGFSWTRGGSRLDGDASASLEGVGR